MNSRLLLLCLALLGGCSKAPAPAAPDAAVVRDNNQGVGLMGQYRYAEAHDVFAALVAAHPELPVLQVNLAIATLNRQQPGDEQQALAMVQAVLKAHPEQLDADYLAGLLQLHLGATGKALEHFRHVTAADPHDAYALYYMAQCEAQLEQLEPALQHYRQAMQQDPYLRSAYYGAFQALQRLGRREEARSLVADYQRLANNPRSRLAEFKYSRMGPRAEASTLGSQAALPLPPPDPVRPAA